ERTAVGIHITPLQAGGADDSPIVVEETTESITAPPSPTANLNQTTLSPSTFAAAIGAISGIGTTGRMTKWTDGPNGVVGDTNISEANGSVVVGVGALKGTLQLFGSATDDVFAGMGPDIINGPAFNSRYPPTPFDPDI